MPNYLIVLTFFLAIFFQSGFAQSGAVVINGKVSDVQKVSLDRALVTILKNDSSIVQSVYTDVNGNFQLADLKKDVYILSVAKAGFQRLLVPVDLKNKEKLRLDLILTPKVNILKEVSINIPRTLLEFRADKTIVNVRNSILAEGSNAADVLERVPGVDYSDGQVALKGRQNVSIMIDGKPTNLNASDLAIKLQSLPAKLIDKVELIENPSAKYEAEGTGGIINIVTRKASVAGLNGSFSSALSTGFYNKYLNSLSLNYRVWKVNVFGDYSYQHNRMLMKNGFSRADAIKTLYADGRRESNADNHSFTAGLDFSVNSRNTVSIVLKT